MININGDSIEGFEAVISDNIGGKKVQLEENTDYTINVEKNNDKYNAIIAGTGNYTGANEVRTTAGIIVGLATKNRKRGNQFERME